MESAITNLSVRPKQKGKAPKGGFGEGEAALPIIDSSELVSCTHIMSLTTPQFGSRRLPPRAGAAAAKMLPSDARVHHRSLVLQHLFDGGPVSRAELSRLTKLARVTVSEVVAGLLADELVVELGVRPGTHMGKPAQLVGINVTGVFTVSLDLSHGTTLRGAVLDLRGALIESRSVDLEGAQGEEATLKVLTLVRQLTEAAPGRVLGIGVGSPGVVDNEGVVDQASNLGWRGLDLRRRLHEDFGLPAYLANDADTAALAEVTFGDGDTSGMLLIEISHGVGAGILLDGMLLRGPEGTAGELGHITVLPDGPECLCGRFGCLEVFLAVPRLRARIDGLDSAHATQELAAMGGHLGKVLAPITQALGLQDVVLSGPTDLLSGSLIETAEETIRTLTLAFANEQVTLRMATHADDGILLGAAALVLNGELGVV